MTSTGLTEKEGWILRVFCTTLLLYLQIENYSSRNLWVDITARIGKARERLGQEGGTPFFKSGPSMFGFSVPKIVPLIEVSTALTYRYVEANRKPTYVSFFPSPFRSGERPCFLVF